MKSNLQRIHLIFNIPGKEKVIDVLVDVFWFLKHLTSNVRLEKAFL